MSQTIREMEAKIQLEEKVIAEMAQQHGEIETAITRIAEQVQRQDTFNEGVRASFTSVAKRLGSTKTTSEKWCGSSRHTRSTSSKPARRPKRWRRESTR